MSVSAATDGKHSKEILEVFAHYRTYHKRSHKEPKSSSKEWRLIRDRLKEGYSVEDLRAAIDGCHRTPFNMGKNDAQRKYDSLELIMRNSSKVQQFMEAPEDGQARANYSQRTINTAQAAADWAGGVDE